MGRAGALHGRAQGVTAEAAQADMDRVKRWFRTPLRHLLRARPEARMELAVHRYQSEELSLAKAADLAGVSWSQMREILVEKGIPPRLGPETAEEAEGEAQALRDFFARR